MKEENNAFLLPVKEAARIYNIGENRLRSMAKAPGCDYSLFIGNRIMIKKKQFEKFLETVVYL